MGEPGDHRRIVHAVVQCRKAKFQAPCRARIPEYAADPPVGTHATTHDKRAGFMLIKGTFDLQPDRLDGSPLE